MSNHLYFAMGILSKLSSTSWQSEHQNKINHPNISYCHIRASLRLRTYLGLPNPPPFDFYRVSIASRDSHASSYLRPIAPIFGPYRTSDLIISHLDHYLALIMSPCKLWTQSPRYAYAVYSELRYSSAYSDKHQCYACISNRYFLTTDLASDIGTSDRNTLFTLNDYIPYPTSSDHVRF